MIAFYSIALYIIGLLAGLYIISQARYGVHYALELGNTPWSVSCMVGYLLQGLAFLFALGCGFELGYHFWLLLFVH